MGKQAVKSKMMVKNPISKMDRIPRPYNRYNLFYILERMRILQTKGARTESDEKDVSASHSMIATIAATVPPRYRNVVMPHNWYLPKPNSHKRLHQKTHGAVSFQELAKTIAENWKTIDDATLEYVSIIAQMLKKMHDKSVTRKNKQHDIDSTAPVLANEHSTLQDHCRSPMQNDNVRGTFLVSTTLHETNALLTGIAIDNQQQRHFSSTPMICGACAPAASSNMHTTSNWVELGPGNQETMQDSERHDQFTFADINDDDIIGMWHDIKN